MREIRYCDLENIAFGNDYVLVARLEENGKYEVRKGKRIIIGSLEFVYNKIKAYKLEDKNVRNNK